MNGLLALTIEAMLDAVRRRLALAVGVVCLLSIMMLDNCTGALPTTMMMNGEEVDIGDTVAGTTGVITFVVLSLWMVVLAGVLAADQLRETLEDGSATLALARPVSRLTFALARLGGVLAVAWGATALLLGSATFLLATRHEVPAPPGILGTLACALGGFVVAAWSMTASLYLPRTATTLMVFAAVGLIAISNLVGLGTEAGGYLGLLDRFGPPLASTVIVAMQSWLPEQLAGQMQIGSTETWGRLTLWAVAGITALAAAVRRIEIGR